MAKTELSAKRTLVLGVEKPPPSFIYTYEYYR